MSKLALFASLLLIGCASNCPQPGGPGAVTARSAEPEATDLVERAEKIAGEACACTTAYCAESRSSELTALLRDRAAGITGDPATRVLVATGRLMACRDKLSYPSDPVDMDGSLGAPASESGTSGSGGSG